VPKQPNPAPAGFSLLENAMSYELYVLILTTVAFYLVFFGRV
jgi:hypothetical protein